MSFWKFVDVMTEIKKKANIKNNTVAFLKMLEICEEHLLELAQKQQIET